MALTAGLLPAMPAIAATAAEFPADQIRAEVARLVPPPWTVEEISVEPMPVPAPDGKPAARDGGARVAARIGARLKLAKPTYLIDAREGPFTFIHPATAPDLEKTLAATAMDDAIPPFDVE